jgi:hypothetical protein
MITEPIPSKQFAVCLNNEGDKAGLEVGKISQVMQMAWRAELRTLNTP